MDPKLFLSTYGLIFLAELPDKTALAVVLLATRERAWPVFLGAASALLVQSVIAVSLGSVLSLLPVHWVHIGAGILFLIFAVFIWRENPEQETREMVKKEEARQRRKKHFATAMGSAFTVIFVSEWGDLTQLATATLAAHQQAPVTIASAATLALWSVSAMSVFLGNRARDSIHPRVLQKVASMAFAGVGCWMLFR